MCVPHTRAPLQMSFSQLPQALTKSATEAKAWWDKSRRLTPGTLACLLWQGAGGGGGAQGGVHVAVAVVATKDASKMVGQRPSVSLR